jgi:hypothetical protein
MSTYSQYNLLFVTSNKTSVAGSIKGTSTAITNFQDATFSAEKEALDIRKVSY